MVTERYNLEYLQSISGGDTDFIKDMILTFIETVPKELSKIYLLLEKKDWDTIGAEAHRFASNLVFMGLDKLRDTAIEIENYCISKNNLDKVPALLDHVKDVCTKNIQFLIDDFGLK